MRIKLISASTAVEVGAEPGKKQAGAELGQAQLKLGLDFTLIFCRIDFTGYSLKELVWLILFCKFY